MDTVILLNIVEDTYSMEVEDGDVVPNNLQKNKSIGRIDRKMPDDETVLLEYLPREAVGNCKLR